MALVAVNSAEADVPPSKPNRKQTMRRLSSYAAPEAVRISLGLSALVVNSLTNLSFPWIIGRALDSAGEEDIRSFFIKSGGFFLAGSLASWVRVYCLGSAFENILKRIRADLFDSLLSQDIEYYESNQTGEVISLLEDDATTAASLFTDKFSSLLRSMNSSINGSILLYSTSPRLTAVSLSVVPIVGVGAMMLMKFSRSLANELRSMHSKILSYGLERVRCISTVRLNHREDYEKEQFNKLLQSSDEVSVSKYNVEGMFMSFTNISTNLSLVAVLRVGGAMIAEGKMTIGALTSFALQTGFVGLGFSGLGSAYSDIIKALDAADRVFKVMDMRKPDVPITAAAVTPVPSSPHDVLTTSSRQNRQFNAIHLEDVCFSYAHRPEITVLSNISLDILPGQITVFVGRSGAGKSTLAALLCGLYVPTDGQISYGVTLLSTSGKENPSGPADSRAVFYELCGVMEQSANNILAGTIGENIAYGKLDASEEDVIAAAKAANAHDFIQSFPEKYATQVGATGCMLSGGQRARIALARALIRRPQYVVLDEPTGALDHASEHEIIQPLLELKQTTSIIIFTHSDALVEAADTVYSIDDGHVVKVR